MASRAILRKKCLLDSVKRPHYLVQGLLCSEHGKLLENSGSQLRSWPVTTSPSGVHSSTKEDSPSLTDNTVQFTLSKNYAGHKFFGVQNLHSRVPGEFTPLGFRWSTEHVRYLKTAAAGKPEIGGDDDKNEEPVVKQKKEASPEECDQAVEGLSSVKAKVKAKVKQLQDSPKGVSFVLKKVWSVLLGIGPALRAVASMSR